MEKNKNFEGDWADIKGIIPYGGGLEAYRSLCKILQDFTVPYIVDADEKKWGTKIYGIEVVSPEVLKNLLPNHKILVTIARRRYAEIAKYLSSFGLRENVDYCHISDFAMDWYNIYKKKYNIFTMDIAITTACTLKCKNCNMFIPYYKQPVMYSFEQLKNNVDLLFKRIDYVFCIGMLGGEALLNPSLVPFINYMYSSYKDKFGSILVTTNGVCPPKQEVIDLFKQYGVLVTISDYRAAINEKSKLKEIERLLSSQGVICNIRRDLIWCDFGFPLKEINIPLSDATKHMLECDPGWRGLNDGRFYFCNCAWSAEKTGLIKLDEKDYIELQNLEADSEESKRRLFEYTKGKLENGYMSFCRHCGGCGADNVDYVDAGVQVVNCN